MTPTVDKSESRVRRMFGSIAPRYDLMNHLLSMNVDRYWRRRTVKRVPPAAGDTVLDLCTGTGDLALAYHHAARRAGNPCHILGADFCPEMLQLGRQKAARAEADISFFEADAQSLPLADQSTDIVTVAFGLRNVTNTEQGLAEMVRVCRPGGKVAILEFSTPNRQPMRAVYGWYFRNALPRLGRLMARNPFDAYDYLPQSVGEFPQGEQLAARMQSAGLQDVSHEPLTFGVATLYVGVRS